MARPRKPAHRPAKNTEGSYLAARIRDAERKGYTQAEIARAYGLKGGARTVRKIKTGESSGKRTFGRLVEPSLRVDTLPGASPSIVRVDIKLGVDADGNDVIRTVNARVPTLPDRTGKRVAATPADVFRVPRLDSLITREIERLERQYGGLVVSGSGQVYSFRPIARRRAPLRIEITGYAE